MTIEEAPDEDEEQQHEPTCDLFNRLREHKNDEELMDVATDFVMQLLRTAQEEALRRGHQVQSKVAHRTLQFDRILLSRSPFSHHYFCISQQIDQKSKLSLELQRKSNFLIFRVDYRFLGALLRAVVVITCQLAT